MNETHDPLLLSLTPDDVGRYLRWTEWKLVGVGSKGSVYRGPNDDSGNPIILKLPSQDTTHVLDAIQKVVSAVAAIENRPKREVIRSIQGIDRDFLYVTLPGEATTRRGISLQSAPDVVRALRDLVAYSASAEEDPRRYFVKAPSIGKKHASKCLFGHTFSGSFGFTVESPLPVSTGPLLRAEEMDRPFERRVMERIGRGIVTLQAATEKERIDELVENYAEGFNANMCEALLKIADVAHRAETSLSLAWSPEWPTLEILQDLEPVVLDTRSYRCLESASRELYPPEKTKAVTVCGKVVLLKSEEAPSEDESVEHLIVIVDESGMRVHIVLDAVTYRSACDAHVKGYDACVDGELVKRGKFWYLTLPRQFRAHT